MASADNIDESTIEVAGTDGYTRCDPRGPGRAYAPLMASERIVKFDIHVDRHSPMPLYHQVARELERAVADGRLRRGDFLDNELVLAKQWQVSRLTLRRSIQELVENGLLVRRRGVGTQVVNDTIPRPPRLGSSYDELIERGDTPLTTVLAHERMVADDIIADQLAIEPGSTVVYIERCRRVANRRIALLRNWVTIDVAGDLTTDQLASRGLFELYRSTGVWPHSATRKITARTAGPVDAALLGVPIGAALLAIDSTLQDTSGSRVEVGQQLYVGSEYTMELAVVDG